MVLEFLFIEKLFKTVIVIIVSLVQVNEIAWKIDIDKLNLPFLKSNREDIYLKVNIPRIGISVDVYNINSVFNNVDYNVEMLVESNVDKNLIFLAGHSGDGDASYFNDLFLLEKGDIIYVNRVDKKMCFRVEEIFYINKNGYFDVSYDVCADTLFLITCSLNYPNQQVVVKSSLLKC